jgi:hypothetical protein
VDITTRTMPADLVPMSRGARLARSLFSRSENAETPAVTRAKLPFTIGADELETLRIPDTRVAGFGPLYGGALAVTALLAVVLARAAPQTAGALLAMSVAIVASALVHPHGWWARYVPQLWLLPLVWAAGATRARGHAARGLGAAVLAVAALDVALAVRFYGQGQLYATRALRAALHELPQRGSPVAIDFGAFPSTRVRLAESGIAFQAFDARKPLPCPQPAFARHLDARVCPAGAPVPAARP